MRPETLIFIPLSKTTKIPDLFQSYFSFLFPGAMIVPGTSSPGDKTPLETFVNDSVSRSLIEYFEDKGDSGKQPVVT